jgi:hypothetical protein
VDECRFDSWTRLVGAKTDRRGAVKGLAGGGAALLALARVELGIAQEADVGIERNCRDNSSRCRRDNQCCSFRCNRRRKKRRGRCRCAREDNRCQGDSACCAGVCRSGRCRCGRTSDFCDNDGDCCSRQCHGDRCRCGRRGDRCDRDEGCCERCRNNRCT